MRLRNTFFLLWLGFGMSAAMIPAAHSSWTADGLALSPNASNYKPAIISDGGTGTIVAWYGGSGSSDIFARRILGDGSTAAGWPANAPLVVCGATGLQEVPTLVPDGSGGALIFWQDARNGSNYDIFAQHIDASGQVVTAGGALWITDGISISSAAGNQFSPMAVSDGAGGAIVVWQDGRQGTGNYDIYAMRVDGLGNKRWLPLAGVPICVAANNQINPTIVADGSGGAYIAWQDYRKGTESDIYVQHVAADGSIFPDPRWTTDGLGVCLASNSQFYPVLAGDGAGGVFAAWQDYRTGTTNHIFAQHLTTSNTGWVTDGVAVSTAINGQFAPQVANDGQGGAFVTWYDSRSGSTNDVYVHELNSQGVLNPLWDKDGLAVCLAPNTQQFPVLAKNDRGTTVMTWQDLRSGGLTTAAIFAQEAGSAGVAGVTLPHPGVAHVSAARPNPSRGASELQLTLVAPTFVRAEVLDIMGRRVATLASQLFSAGAHTLSWNGNDTRGAPTAPGVYLVRVQWPGFEKTQRVVRLR